MAAWDPEAPGSLTLVEGHKVTVRSPFSQRQVGPLGGDLPGPASCTSDASRAGGGVALSWG